MLSKLPNEVRVILDPGRKQRKVKFDSFPELYEMISPYMTSLDRENMVVMMLDSSMDLICSNTVSIGTSTSVTVHANQVFKPAILANADYIVLAHNHPDSTSEPSENDVILTKKIRQFGSYLSIELADHVIFGIDGYFSFFESNRLFV